MTTTLNRPNPYWFLGLLPGARQDEMRAELIADVEHDLAYYRERYEEIDPRLLADATEHESFYPPIIAKLEAELTMLRGETL